MISFHCKILMLRLIVKKNIKERKKIKKNNLLIFDFTIKIMKINQKFIYFKII